MNFAKGGQKFQDWFTQQWVIIWGKKINSFDYPWLMGPYGNIESIGENFIYQLAEKENLKVKRNVSSKGLLNSFSQLQLSDNEISKLSKRVIDFYEKTSDYKLKIKVKWNPIFLPFGYIVNKFFSQRINQLNIPTENINESEDLISEIIELSSKESKKIIYTIWLRKYLSTGKIIYSGIYTTCTLVDNSTCVKAIFPLPKGNATVILKPTIGLNDEFILNSSGKKFGDPGFYFLLSDSKGNNWAQYLKSFTDKLVVLEEQKQLYAFQTLKLWGINVARFHYNLIK